MNPYKVINYIKLFLIINFISLPHLQDFSICKGYSNPYLVLTGVKGIITS